MRNILKDKTADSAPNRNAVRANARCMWPKPSLNTATPVIPIPAANSEMENALNFERLKNMKAAIKTIIPKTVIELSRKKIVTLFVDGDRGGDMIINSFMQQGHVDFIAKAPSGTEVEELSKKEINQSLRAKVPIDEYDPSMRREPSASRKPPQSAPVDVPQQIKEKVMPLINDIIGTRGAFLVNDKFEILGRIPYKGVEDAILNLENIHMLILDGIVTEGIAKAAEESGISFVIGSKVLAGSSSVKLFSYDDIGYKYR